MESYVRDLANANGYRGSGDLFWKEKDNYLITMKEESNKIAIEIRSGLEEGTMPNAVGEKVSEIYDFEKVKHCRIDKASILLFFGFERLTASFVEETTDQLIQVMKENMIPSYNKCELCKQSMTSGDNAYIKINDRFVKVHKDCYSSLVDRIEDEKNNPKGSYITGIIGALIFGAIGTIPWILVGIAGWFASILGMVIGISANFGYDLFKGRRGKIKGITLFAVLIVMVIAAGFVTQMYVVVKYLSSLGLEDISLANSSGFVIELLKGDSGYAMSFVKNVALGIGFGLLGAWRLIRKSSEEPAITQLNVERVE